MSFHSLPFRQWQPHETKGGRLFALLEIYIFLLPFLTFSFPPLFHFRLLYRIPILFPVQWRQQQHRCSTSRDSFFYITHGSSFLWPVRGVERCFVLHKSYWIKLGFVFDSTGTRCFFFPWLIFFPCAFYSYHHWLESWVSFFSTVCSFPPCMEIICVIGTHTDTSHTPFPVPLLGILVY